MEFGSSPSTIAQFQFLSDAVAVCLDGHVLELKA